MHYTEVYMINSFVLHTSVIYSSSLAVSNFSTSVIDVTVKMPVSQGYACGYFCSSAVRVCPISDVFFCKENIHKYLHYAININNIHIVQVFRTHLQRHYRAVIQ